MIKINWKRLLVERGCLGFHATLYNKHLSPHGREFEWYWYPK